VLNLDGNAAITDVCIDIAIRIVLP